MTALHSIRQGIPLAIEKIEKAFGERQVLKGIDLHIPAGQFVAVVGRSGCGKSTLLRLLAGLDQPSGGQLLAGSGPLNAVRDDIRRDGLDGFGDHEVPPFEHSSNSIDSCCRGRPPQYGEDAHRARARVRADGSCTE